MNKKLEIKNWHKISAKRAGFTLVELLIAISLFVIVASISIGAILSVFSANKKAQSSKTVVDNLNLAIENMARTVRFGGNYYCGVSNDTSEPIETNNCSFGGSAISVTFDGQRIVYRWGGTENDPIEKSEDGGSNYTAITAPETRIQYVKFYVFGSDSTDNEQPHVIAVIKGHVGNQPTSQTVFSLETLMSQRTLDL